ncbi:hypothetical protein PUN28_011583 [Cardiocondyla obscurior]|uniref:Uncharacterized protein n=1 Tax=Cardiocondyla obscurior TaxID=286306 RepID=A0AAW2FEN6_9HYME
MAAFTVTSSRRGSGKTIVRRAAESPRRQRDRESSVIHVAKMSKYCCANFVVRERRGERFARFDLLKRDAAMRESGRQREKEKKREREREMEREEGERKRKRREKGTLYAEKRFYGRSAPRLTFSAGEKPSWIRALTLPLPLPSALPRQLHDPATLSLRDPSSTQRFPLPVIYLHTLSRCRHKKKLDTDIRGSDALDLKLSRKKKSPYLSVR